MCVAITYEEQFLRGEPVILSVEDTIVTYERLETKPVFGVSLDPTAEAEKGVSAILLSRPGSSRQNNARDN